MGEYGIFQTKIEKILLAQLLQIHELELLNFRFLDI